MKPFTALKFFIENKRRGLICFIVLIFTVCAVSLITSLVNSIPETAYDSDVKSLLYYSGVYSNSKPLEDSVIKELENFKSTDRLIAAQYSRTRMDLAIGGNTSVPVIFIEADDLSYVVDKTHLKVREGRLPEDGKDEIAVHWRVLKNKGWQIGDMIGQEVDSNEWFPGKYEIVGVFDGPGILSVGIKANPGVDKDGNHYFYLAFFKEGERSEFNDYLSSISSPNFLSLNYEEAKKDLDETLSSLGTTLLVIIIVVVLILSISVSSLMYIIYLQRLDEFGIMYALGYKRAFIRNMIMKEIFTLNIFGWLFGFLFSIFVIYILNTLLYYPKGNIVNVYNIRVLIYTLIIPIIVAGASILPITRKLKKCDPIAIIERRE
jgi:putative ABC transport system permease protein